jgi:hypothetical protein
MHTQVNSCSVQCNIHDLRFSKLQPSTVAPGHWARRRCPTRAASHNLPRRHVASPQHSEATPALGTLKLTVVMGPWRAHMAPQPRNRPRKPCWCTTCRRAAIGVGYRCRLTNMLVCRSTQGQQRIATHQAWLD